MPPIAPLERVSGLCPLTVWAVSIMGGAGPPRGRPDTVVTCYPKGVVQWQIVIGSGSSMLTRQCT